MKISREEKRWRTEIVRQAEANNRIDGISCGPESKPIFDAYINGDIEVTDLVPRLKALYGIC